MWILVVMLLAAGAFALWVDRLRDDAFLQKASSDAYIQGTNFYNQVLYTYLTQPQGIEGVAWPDLNGQASSPVGFASLDDFLSGAPPAIQASTPAGHLALNGEVLDLGQGMRGMVQDRAGLIGLFDLSQSHVFQRVGESANLNWQLLRDTLYDYQDNDYSRLPQGAEFTDYRRLSKPAPLNGPLRTELQLRQILWWSDAFEGWSDAELLMRFKAIGNGYINVNTAPSGVLHLSLPLGQSPDSILALRQDQGPIASIFDLPASADGERPYLTLPSGGIRVWYWHTHIPVATVYDIQFKPLASGRRLINVNWVYKVALTNEMANRPAKQVNHPFFRSASSQ